MLRSSLLLNGQCYKQAKLINLCQHKITSNHLADWERNLYLFIQQWLDNTQTIAIKTSGSTGTAKTINVFKSAMRQSAQMTGQYFQLKPNDNALLCLPTTYIAGQMMVVRAFVLGLNLIPIRPNAISFGAFNQCIDFVAMLPLQLYQLLASNPTLEKFKTIKTVLIGGASVSLKSLHAIQNLTTKVYQSYGMTETVSHIAIRCLNSPQELTYSVLEGIQIKQDMQGRLVIHAPHLGVHQLKTHDVIRLHSKNQFELLGRIDNIINSGGIKFNPEQLEAQIERFIPTRRFFISGVDDEKLGSKLVLWIEGQPFTLLEMKTLQDQISHQLDKYQQPKVIRFLNQFKQTPTGKIQRKINLAAALSDIK